MKELADDLRARRARARGMGGPEAIATQNADGKMAVRERSDLLKYLETIRQKEQDNRDGVDALRQQLRRAAPDK